MSFIHEVDSLRSKLHISSVNPFVLAGIVLLVLVIAGYAVFTGVTYFLNSSLDEGFSYQTAQDQEISSDSNDLSDINAEKRNIFIHVGGAVVSPGLYELQEGSRVKDAIDAAGGLVETANIDSVNLAEVLVDGTHLVVADSAQVSQSSGNSTSSSAGSASGKININTASLAELKTLDGVGDSTAQRIIDYRESQGRFNKIEDVKKVSGIGDKKFAAIKDSICV